MLFAGRRTRWLREVITVCGRVGVWGWGRGWQGGLAMSRAQLYAWVTDDIPQQVGERALGSCNGNGGCGKVGRRQGRAEH